MNKSLHLSLFSSSGRRSTCRAGCQRWTGCWASATSSTAPQLTWWRASVSTTSTHGSAANTPPCLARAPTSPARPSTPTTSPSVHPKEFIACSWPKSSLAGECWGCSLRVYDSLPADCITGKWAHCSVLQLWYFIILFVWSKEERSIHFQKAHLSDYSQHPLFDSFLCQLYASGSQPHFALKGAGGIIAD